MTSKTPSRARREINELAAAMHESGTLDAAILEMAGDARAAGVMDEITHRKITMRDPRRFPLAKPRRLG